MVKKVFLIFCLIITCSLVNAQPGDPNVDPDVPIGGIEILLVLGGVLGVRRFVKKNK